MVLLRVLGGLRGVLTGDGVSTAGEGGRVGSRETAVLTGGGVGALREGVATAGGATATAGLGLGVRTCF